MRILLIAPGLPIEAGSGGQLRNYQVYKELQTFAIVDVVSCIYADMEPNYFSNFKQSNRFLGSIKIPLNIPSGDTNMPLHKGIKALIESENYDYIVVRYYNLAYWLGLFGLKNIVLDCDDCILEGIWQDHRKIISRKPSVVKENFIARKHYKITKKIYLNNLSTVNHVLFAKASSRYEWQDNYLLYPNKVKALPRVNTKLSDKDKPLKILFVGFLAYPPNHKGLEHFVKKIWPSISRNRKNIILKVVGDRLPEELAERWAKIDNIELCGYVDNIADAYADSSFSICPVYKGSGTHIKVIESLMYGKTMVVTPMAHRGYEQTLPHNECLFVAKSNREFVNRTIELIDSAEKRQQLAEKGRQNVIRHHAFNDKPIFFRELLAPNLEIDKLVEETPHTEDTFNYSDIDIPTDNLVPFTVTKLKQTTAAWVNTDNYTLIGSTSADELCETYAYAVVGTDCLDDCQFDHSQTKTAYAERYGGVGTANNGGGGRCGNFNNLQVKGLGQTCVIGKDTEKWHAHGNLTLAVAVYEAIFSEVLVNILPYGSVRCYGLISTGDNTAYDTYSEDEELIYARGALMLREECVRPAHYLRAGFYKIHPQYKNVMTGDVARVKKIYSELNKKFSDKGQFIDYLGNFLSNCASQFASARVNRIAHGSLSPSNFTMDGKWLDLPKVNFMETGINYTSLDTSWSYSFYDEPYVVIDTLKDFIYTYNKYSGANVDVNPLINYFTEQFTYGLKFYAGSIFGFTHETIHELIDHEKYTKLCDGLMSLINSGKEIVLADPAITSKRDKMELFLEAIFSGENPYSIPYFSETRKAFFAVFDHIFVEDTEKRIRYLKALTLTALKKAYLHNFYFRGRIYDIVDSLCADAPMSEIANFIQYCIDVSEWAHQEYDECVILFRDSNFELSYLITSGIYEVKNFISKESYKYDSENALLNFISTKNSSELNRYHYDFKSYLLRLVGAIPTSVVPRHN